MLRECVEKKPRFSDGAPIKERQLRLEQAVGPSEDDSADFTALLLQKRAEGFSTGAGISLRGTNQLIRAGVAKVLCRLNLRRCACTLRSGFVCVEGVVQVLLHPKHDLMLLATLAGARRPGELPDACSQDGISWPMR